MRVLRIVVLIAAIAATGNSALAGTIRATVNDGGKPVGDAVVFATPVGGGSYPAPSAPVIVDQVDKEYVPYVTPIQVGTTVNFPNSDQIRHHVYSFSEARSFEIPLYEGIPPQPIVFDKPGPVAIGCNIHDWMAAYVFVSESPYFAVTSDDGTATIGGLPSGEYKIGVWHPRIKGEYESTLQRVAVGDGSGSPVAFTIKQKRIWRPRRSPSGGDGGYR
jgi:plastocyanin